MAGMGDAWCVVSTFAGDMQMLIEIAQFPIRSDAGAAFESALKVLKPAFIAFEGCSGFDLAQSLDSESTYFLLIRWATADAQSRFRQSTLAEQIGPIAERLFEGAPLISNTRIVEI